MMISSRVNQVIFGIVLLASLLANSVAACSCSHHQIETVHKTASCHGASHDRPETAPAKDNGSSSLESGCACLVKDATPIVAAKSEKKTPEFQSDCALPTACTAAVELSLIVTVPDPAPVYSGPSLNFRSSDTSTPPRAPPRL